MVSPVRDALLAVASAAVLLAALAWTGSLAAVADPLAAAAGVAAALVVEAAFVTDTPAADLWERRRWRVGATLVFLGGVAALTWLAGPLVLAAACWGLATYFALLAVVVTGVWNPDGESEDAGE